MSKRNAIWHQQSTREEQISDKLAQNVALNSRVVDGSHFNAIPSVSYLTFRLTEAIIETILSDALATTLMEPAELWGSHLGARLFTLSHPERSIDEGYSADGRPKIVAIWYRLILASSSIGQLDVTQIWVLLLESTREGLHCPAAMNIVLLR